MGDFIAQSQTSKNALNMANLASTLPVQVLIFGEIGTGKRSLGQIIAPDAEVYDAQELQRLIKEDSFNLDENQIQVFIICNIDKANNIKQFVEKLEKHNIKIIATATTQKESFSEKFAVKIDIPPLSERPEDLKALSKNYLLDANGLFDTDVKIEDIEIDVSKNSISLKRSIYTGVLVDSANLKQVLGLLERFLYKQMDEVSEYKDLLEIFEIPLIKASRSRFKSQLQMAQKLNINRNTLRKKINQYHLEE